MLLTEVMDIGAGREIDYLIERRVFRATEEMLDSLTYMVPYYSMNIRDAKMLQSELSRRFRIWVCCDIFEEETYFEVTLRSRKHPNIVEYWVFGNTEELVICRAALLTVS